MHERGTPQLSRCRPIPLQHHYRHLFLPNLYRFATTDALCPPRALLVHRAGLSPADPNREVQPNANSRIRPSSDQSEALTDGSLIEMSVVRLQLRCLPQRQLEMAGGRTCIEVHHPYSSRNVAQQFRAPTGLSHHSIAIILAVIERQRRPQKTPELDGATITHLSGDNSRLYRRGSNAAIIGNLT